MRRPNVMIIGAAGFLGQACTRALVARGQSVIGVDVVADPGAGAADWLVADMARTGLLADALADTDTVLHLAWRNDPGRGNTDMAGDVIGNVANAVRVFEQAALADVRRLVYASSGGTIYGRAAVPTPEDHPIAPIGGYGAGKAAAELYLSAIHNAHGPQVCSLRIANPYGPGQLPNRGQGFIATAIARTLAREPIQIFGSTALSRDYIFIDDVADAMAMACDDDRPHSIYNVGSGRDLSLADLIPLVFAAVGHETEIQYTPSRSVDIPRMLLDIGRIEAALGWRPGTGIEEGLGPTVDWLRSLPGSPRA